MFVVPLFYFLAVPARCSMHFPPFPLRCASQEPCLASKSTRYGKPAQQCYTEPISEGWKARRSNSRGYGIIADHTHLSAVNNPSARASGEAST